LSTFLFLSHVVPYPCSAGNELRIANLIAWLRKQGHEVIYLLNAGSLDAAARAQLEERVDRLYLLDRPYDGDAAAGGVPDPWKGVVREARRWAETLLPRLPPGRLHDTLRRHLRLLDIQDFLASPAMVQATRALCRLHAPRAVVVEYVFATPCLAAVPAGTLKLVDTHDVFSRRMSQVIRHGIDDPHHISRRRERRYLLKTDVVIAIQRDEARALARLAPERETITLGIDFPVVNEVDVRRVVSGRLLIVGSDNPLNIHGAKQFQRHAWPEIREACPDAVVRVVGKLAAGLRSQDDRFQLVGWRDRLDDEWSEACVVLNPTVAGTGLKIKSVEALSRAKPLVATLNAVEGIVATGPPPFVACADWPAFARGTIELLRAPEKRLPLQERALAYARANLDAERVYQPLADLLRRRLSPDGPRC
jgi:glycosyltransferase involved in cell wall biosynthesis